MNQQKHTKKIPSLNLIRNHVGIMTAVTVIIILLITNIKIAIILIAVTKNDYHNNNNSNNSNNNNLGGLGCMIFFFFGGGRGESPKKGAWIVCRFNRRLGKRRGHVFEVGRR